MISYPTLKAEQARQGITNTQMAETMGVSEKSFRNKIRGITTFTLSEALSLRKAYFPNMEIECLFKPYSTNTGNSQETA